MTAQEIRDQKDMDGRLKIEKVRKSIENALLQSKENSISDFSIQGLPTHLQEILIQELKQDGFKVMLVKNIDSGHFTVNSSYYSISI